MQTDINRDGVVNMIDISIVAKSFGTRPEDIDWNPKADLNREEVVNNADITMTDRSIRSSMREVGIILSAIGSTTSRVDTMLFLRLIR